MRGTRSNEAQPNYHRQGLSRYLLQIASPPPYPLNLVRLPRGRTSSIITRNPYLLGIDRIQIPRRFFHRQELTETSFSDPSKIVDQKRDLSCNLAVVLCLSFFHEKEVRNLVVRETIPGTRSRFFGILSDF